MFSGSVYIDYTREKEVEGRTTKNEIVEKKIRSRKKEEESE